MNPGERRVVRVHARARGIVQGVGFRPFVFRLARRYQLAGGVRNDSRGVDIEVEGPAEAVRAFLDAVLAEAPPAACIERLDHEEIEPSYDREFVIWPSRESGGERTFPSPDLYVCADCLRELFDPADRRFRYPFINCTNCGPRYTIILDLPYDRPQTTMRAFRMCDACEREYRDPGNRRFHAQPNACPACGPRAWLDEGAGETARGDAAIRRAQDLLRAGRIVAVKGVGGFHLAADAANEEAVAALRERKRREQKPFAVMCADLDAARRYGFVSDAEAELLTSPAAPIVLLRRRPDAALAPGVAPASPYVGVLLPSAPLHHLLLRGAPGALVMTSGNLTDEPIAIDNAEAVQRLAGVADAFLLHDRDIRARADDSVCRVDAGAVSVLRRSRGYAPAPLPLRPGPVVLALGAELKNTVCLALGEHAVLSPHIGDLKNLETLLFFRKTIQHLERLFDAAPEILAHDLHPDYLSTRYAVERAAREPGLRRLAVQHHYAHIAACMAEHGLDERVIGVAFDGTGYGVDGAVWGGEFLLADWSGFRRAGRLRYVALPGGDAAVKRPGRMAASHLRDAFGPDWPARAPTFAARLPEPERRVVDRMIERNVNCPLTSSMGRLFDAAAALCGVTLENSYEGQAPMEFEALVDETERGSYPWRIDREGECWVADTRPLIAALADDLRAGADAGRVAARFHRAVAALVVDMCVRIREHYGADAACLSGGVFQNQRLIEWAAPALERAGFRVYRPLRAPANDGGVALGQAALARAWAARGEPLVQESLSCA